MTELPGQVEQQFGPIPDPVKATALANAVDLARSNEPILPDAVPDVALAVLELAAIFEEYLRGPGPP